DSEGPPAEFDFQELNKHADKIDHLTLQFEEFKRWIVAEASEIAEIATVLGHYYLFLKLEDPKAVESLLKNCHKRAHFSKEFITSVSSFVKRADKNSLLKLRFIGALKDSEFQSERTTYLAITNAFEMFSSFFNGALTIPLETLSELKCQLENDPMLPPNLLVGKHRTLAPPSFLFNTLACENEEILVQQLMRPKEDQVHPIFEAFKNLSLESQKPPQQSEGSSFLGAEVKEVLAVEEKTVSPPLLDRGILPKLLEELKRVSSVSKTPSFTGLGATHAYANSIKYQDHLMMALQRLTRVIQSPSSPSLLAAQVLSIGILGAGSIEQCLTAKMAEHKQFSSEKELHDARTHNILKLYKSCNFTPCLDIKDFNLIKDVNLGGILTRNIPFYYDEVEHPQGILKLYIKSYLFTIEDSAKKDPLLQASSLLKDAAKYIQRILMSRVRLERFFNDASPCDEAAAEAACQNFLKQLNAGCRYLSFSKQRPLQDLFFQDALDQIDLLDKRWRQLYTHASACFEKLNFDNLFFLLKWLQAELKTYSLEHPEEIDLLNFNVLQLNRLIVKECLYTLLENQGQLVDRHGKGNTLKELAELVGLNKLTTQQTHFLLEEKEIFFLVRYGSEKSEQDASSPARMIKKSTAVSKYAKEAVFLSAQDEEGFEVVKSNTQNQLISGFNNVLDTLKQDISLMNQLAEKIMSTFKVG
ncbi:MAG: hypothetical protein ACM3JI_04010, partial [Anaerolineae bacterium]